MNGFEKRAEQKKLQILETTFKILNTEGLDKLVIDDIAKNAEVGKTTIFKYFKNKENLIHEVYAYFLNMIREDSYNILEKNMPFEETLIAMSENKITYLERVNQQFYIDMMDYLTEKNDKGISLLMESYSRESSNIMLDIFHRGKKEGKVDLKYSDEFLLLYFQALIEGVSSPRVYENILPYTKEWTEVMIKGLAPYK